jgi:hypothetical protein
VTLADGHLWWTFAEAAVTPLGAESNENGARMRRAIGGWKNCDVNGKPLRAAAMA